MRPLYGQLDHALEQWKETLQEVEQVGGAFWAVHEFQHVPGVGPIAAHVFSAVIEEPSRFATKFKLWKYSQLGDHRSHQRQQTARLSAPGAAGKRGTQKPLPSRLARRLQIHHRPKCHQELLPAKPLTHSECASCAAQHSAQDPRSALASRVFQLPGRR